MAIRRSVEVGTETNKKPLKPKETPQEKVEATRKEMLDYILKEVIEGKQRIWESPIVKSPMAFQNYSANTGRTYRGVNQLYLTLKSWERGYTDPRWITLRQANDLGYKIKKGSKGVRIAHWKFVDEETIKRDENGKPIRDKDGNLVKEKVLDENGHPRQVLQGPNISVVYNAEQVENFPVLERPVLSEEDKVKELETILNHSEASIHYDSLSGNYYAPKRDEIHLHPKEDFKSMGHLYATALHEIGHSTGHPSRLNRKLTGIRTTEDYAKEELVAELTAAMLNAKYNLPFTEAVEKENSIGYLQGWHEAVQKDPKLLFAAAKQADEASRYIEEKMLLPFLDKELAAKHENPIVSKREIELEPPIFPKPPLETEAFKTTTAEPLSLDAALKDVSITINSAKLPTSLESHYKVFINKNAYLLDKPYQGEKAYQMMKDFIEYGSEAHKNDNLGYSGEVYIDMSYKDCQIAKNVYVNLGSNELSDLKKPPLDTILTTLTDKLTTAHYFNEETKKTEKFTYDLPVNLESAFKELRQAEMDDLSRAGSSKTDKPTLNSLFKDLAIYVDSVELPDSPKHELDTFKINNHTYDRHFSFSGEKAYRFLEDLVEYNKTHDNKIFRAKARFDLTYKGSEIYSYKAQSGINVLSKFSDNNKTTIENILVPMKKQLHTKRYFDENGDFKTNWNAPLTNEAKNAFKALLQAEKEAISLGLVNGIEKKSLNEEKEQPKKQSFKRTIQFPSKPSGREQERGGRSM